jgi:hypothetical protein
MKTLLMGLLLISSFAATQESVLCTNDQCVGSSVTTDGKYAVITTVNSSGLSQQIINRDANYHQTLCLSCTNDETARSKQLLKLAYYETDDGTQLDVDMLMAFLRETSISR